MKLLKYGTRGKPVEDLQKLLQGYGFYKGAIDGDYGKLTVKAVKAFQKHAGLMEDGIAGKRVWAMIVSKQFDSFQMTEGAIQAAAKELDMEVALVRTVAEVESMGDGFLEPGKPKILFERHVMRQRLEKRRLGLLAEIAQKARPDLVNKDTGGYRGGKLEHTRLDKAKELNPIAAVESASWGRFQIMGYHWEALGYKSVQDWEGRMRTSEDEHLAAFVKFIKESRRMYLALKSKNFELFAKLYNGPAYAKNKYDVKLAEAYEHHSLDA